MIPSIALLNKNLYCAKLLAAQYLKLQTTLYCIDDNNYYEYASTDRVILMHIQYFSRKTWNR